MQAKNLILFVLLGLSASLFLIWRSVRKKTVKKELPQTIIVGTNAEYPPYTFIEDNQIVGFDIDIAKEVFKKIGKTFEIKDMSWTALIPAIQLGQIQVIAAGMTATPQRAKHVIFTKPYVKGDPLLIVNLAKNPTINDIDELKDKKVIVNEGYTADIYMSNIKGPILQRLPSPTEGFLALKSERADAYVIAKSSANQFFDKHGDLAFNAVEIPDEAAGESYSLAISKKYPELLDKIQSALDEMEKDGTIQSLKNKWNIR